MMNKLTEEMTLEIEEITANTLRLLGLSGAYKGFGYIIYGVKCAIADPGILTFVCKGLYPDIAREFETTSQCAERNIRTARQVIWKYGSGTLRNEIFGERYRDIPPDNRDFVDALKSYIERQVRKRFNERSLKQS